MAEINMGEKAQLVNLTNSLGWAIALKYAEAALVNLERQALECDDEKEILGLARRARGAREFWNSFITTINQMKDPTDNDFVEVSMD